GQHVGRGQVREHLVKVVQLGEATAQHDHVRIEDVDNMRQTASEAARVARERSLRMGVSTTRSRSHRLSINALSRRPGVIGCQTWTGNPRLDAAGAPAPAEGTGVLVDVRPRYRVVAPLAADSPRTIDEDPLTHKSATAAGAEYDAEHTPLTGPGAVHRLGKGKAVGVIGQPHWTAQVCLEVTPERFAV